MFVHSSTTPFIIPLCFIQNRYLDGNCVIKSELNYASESVVINFGYSQERCVNGMCDLEKRRDGCVMCSDDGERCVTCGSGYVLFDGDCVGCLPMEECVFNNSVEIECVNESDLNHCPGGGQGYVNCSEHVCINSRCESGEIGGEGDGDEEECMIGGSGCRGCKCMRGWHTNKSADCYSLCGDGVVAGNEECEKGGQGCDDDNCLCDLGWEEREA